MKYQIEFLDIAEEELQDLLIDEIHDHNVILVIGVVHQKRNPDR